MTPWFRIPGGWAVNLDGSNASLSFSLPRVEVRSSSAGWTSEAFFPDGSRAVCAPPYPGGAAVVMSEALEHARRMLAAIPAAAAPAE
ncbi:MAG: hypothetical protein HZB56_22940 [Deltaproteobacteria bacterium]|nr:hypothetical protein [Deltaproteobacteria bacterium]